MKRALDLPITTSNNRLQAVGMTNTFRELREAHLINQYTRLAQTESGRRLLNRIHIDHAYHTEGRTRVPELWRGALKIRPLPRNTGLDNHEGRREARARAIKKYYGNKPGVFYADAAGPVKGGWYTAAVAHAGEQIDRLSF